MNQLIVNADLAADTISRHIYGHFAEHLGRCIYEGIWVGEDSPIPHTRGIRQDVVQALRAINIPVLRWPGGCFADEYHWKDGIGPRTARPSMVNTHWGGVTENNHFGTHEFFDLCDQLGCAPYICGNVGSGSVQEMQQWVEYATLEGSSPMADWRRANGRAQPWTLPYFGVGNENWGCGGSMRAEYYADEYRRYQTYVRNLGAQPIYKIACGPCHADYHWTEVLMREAGAHMQGLSLHYYCGSGRVSRSATQFDEGDWFALLKNALLTEELVTRHATIMDRYDPERRVGLIVDEWGSWHEVEPGSNPGFLYQQNTLRDALVAAVTLNIFNQHCARVKMANIAQTINVLQAVVLTEGEKMLLTPTYHVFELYKAHQDAAWLPTQLASDTYCSGEESIPQLSASASRDQAGVVHLTLCNLHPRQQAALSIVPRGFTAHTVTGRVLTAATMQAHNTFTAPETVRPALFTGAQLQQGGQLVVTLPAKSVVSLALQGG